MPEPENGSALPEGSAPEGNRLGRRWIDAAISPILVVFYVVFAFVQWTMLLGPPERAEGWAGIGIAIALPLVTWAWLRKRVPVPRLFALSSGSLGLLALVVMLATIDARSPIGLLDSLFRPHSSAHRCFSPCEPFSSSEDFIAPGRLAPRVAILGAQALIALLGLQLGLRAGRKGGPHRPDRTTAFALVALAHLASGIVFAETAFLGYPARFGGSPFEIARDDFMHFRDRQVADWMDDGNATTVLAFDLARSFQPEYFTIVLRLGPDEGRFFSLRALYCEAEERFRIRMLERPLDRQDSRRIAERLDASGLFELSQEDVGSAGLDGSIWRFEGHSAGQQIAVEAWSPTYRADYRGQQTLEALATAEQAGRLLLAESGFAVCERVLY